MKKISVLILLLSRIVFPCSVFALNISISEIQFDPVGADTGREWIRLTPINGEDVDSKDLLILEEGVRHKLAAATSSSGVLYQKIPSGIDIVVVDNPVKFIQEYPDYKGALLDSVFSLKNSGEPISLLFKGEIVDEFIPPSPFLESGDGRVWQKINGEWSLGTSTLLSKVVASTTSATFESASPAAETASPEVEWIEPESIELKPRIYFPKVQTAGVSGSYEARTFSKQGEVEVGVKYYWNFGNGETAEGQNVAHAYLYPGKFAVSLTAVSNKASMTKYESIEVIKPNIDVITVVPGLGGYVELRNNENRFIELSGFIVSTQYRGEKQSFALPSKTYLAPKGQARMTSPNSSVNFGSEVEILYPNGRFFTRGLIK